MNQQNNPILSAIGEDGEVKTLGEIKSETIQLSSERVRWYEGYYPYTEIIKTREQAPYLFALTLNDKLVAIGAENGREGGVFAAYNLIDRSWLDFKKTFLKSVRLYKESEERHKNGQNNPSPCLKFVPQEPDRNYDWSKLYDLIKDKKYIGKRELPPQPQTLLYRTFHNDNLFMIYENRWHQPNRFVLWSRDKQKVIRHSNRLSDVTDKLGAIVGRKINLIQ